MQPMKKLLAPFSLTLAFLGVLFAGFLTSANAAGTVDPGNTNLLDMARPIFDQIMSGHYVAAAAFALVLSVALLKRYAPGKLGEFVHSDPGGATATMLMAFGGALATATMGGAPWTWAMCWTALGVGVAAVGGYTAIKKLFIEPVLRPLMAKAPSWAQPIFALIMWVFDKPTSSVKAAEAAGTTAVAENPGPGTTSIAGEPKDI